MIVNAFSEGLDQIPSSEFAFEELVGCLDVFYVNRIWIETDILEKSASSQNVRAKEANSHNSIQKQAAAALMDEVNKEIIGEVGYQGRNLQKIQTHGGSFNQSGSWAQIAGSLPTYPTNHQEMEYMSPVSMTALSASKYSQNSDEEESELPTSHFHGAGVSSMSSEIPETKAAILRVSGRMSKDIIQFITTRIHEGPLQDIKVETNGRARVTFQHAVHGLMFLNSHKEMESLLGFGRLGPGVSVELLEVVEWNEDHRRMNQPVRERRRLSFARKRLFAENMSPEKWKQDIRTLAGPGNIDFLWVFNSGNGEFFFALEAHSIFTSWVY